MIRDIYLRDIDMYMLDRSYLGVDSINVYPPYNLTFGVGCQDQVPTVPFSVGINGTLVFFISELNWRPTIYFFFQSRIFIVVAGLRPMVRHHSEDRERKAREERDAGRRGRYGE